MDTRHTSADVIVVGAGIAGLTAARDIAREGRSVMVLEARDRVGGRTVGHPLQSGYAVEMGGAYVGPYQTAVLALIEELGLETFPTYDTGDGISSLNGVIARFAADDQSLGLPGDSLPEINRVMGAIDALASDVAPASPWSTPGAVELDRRTFEAWLTSSTSDPVALSFFRWAVSCLFCRETWEMSLLHVLFYVRSNGLMINMISTTGGNQESRVKGGSHRISERLAEDLGDDVVRLNAPVRAIRQDADRVTVAFDGGVATAQRIIVTLPPALASRVRYDPPLPPERDVLAQQMPMGSVIKVQAAYDAPFWRGDGLSGGSFDIDGPVSFVYDGSPPDASFGALTGFITGDRARRMASRSPGQRRGQVVESLVRMFGSRAADPIEYVEMDWSAEEYTRGCYGGHFGAGVWTRFGAALAEPAGQIHWAGTETADISNGYMDGAVRSGQRAAAEVLAALPALARV